MNKNDFKLICILCFICLIFIIIFRLNSHSGNQAYIYHNGSLIKTVDLNIDDSYVVEGDNGSVVVEVLNGKIRVNEENSPLHLCSRQGFISKSNESIVCLPNKIVINVGKSDLDAVVK